MTTQSWTFPVDHQNDAGFRAWGADFSSKLAAVGLVQTVDTGQIDWGTATRPSTNADAGYEIWRFDDTQQASAPVFLKFRYGTDDVTSAPRILVDIGDASDGAGTLSLFGGAASSFDPTWGTVSSTQTPAGTSRYSFMVHTEGFFAFLWCLDIKTSGLAAAAMIIARTHDDQGVPDGDALLVIHPGNSSPGTSGSNINNANRTISYLTQQVYNGLGAGSCLIPSNQTDSLVDGTDPQLFIHWAWTPRVKPVYTLASYLLNDFVDFTTVEAQLLGGSAPRTYLMCGRYFGKSAYAHANQGTAILWE